MDCKVRGVTVLDPAPGKTQGTARLRITPVGDKSTVMEVNLEDCRLVTR